MIQFTCASDHPTPYREWRGIEIERDASPSILRWVRVEHAIFGLDAYGPALVSHCVFWKCHSGIYLEADFTGDVRHNVSAYHAVSGILCKGTRAEATIVDNVFYANGDGIYAWFDAVAYADYNLYWSPISGNASRYYKGMAPGPHDRVADPRFADPQKGNFELPKDSPAMGAGSSGGSMGLDLGGWTEPIREKEDREWLSDTAQALWCEGLQIEHGIRPLVAGRYPKGVQDQPSAAERYREAMERAATPELKDKIACSLAGSGGPETVRRGRGPAGTGHFRVYAGIPRDLARSVLAETRALEGKPEEALRIVGTVEWPQSQVWAKPATARYSAQAHDYQQAFVVLADIPDDDPYRYTKALSETITKMLAADQVEGAVTLMPAFEKYPLAVERSAACLEIAKAARRLQRPQVAADILRQGINCDPFGRAAPESLSLLATILEKELDRPAEAQEVLTRLCVGYCPYDRYVLQAVEKVRVNRPDPNHTILLEASLGEASIFDRYPLVPAISDSST